MYFIEIVKAHYLSFLFGGLGGVATSWLTQRVLSKRGVFSYHVNHQHVGASAEDLVFGSVSVTWNGNPVQNLYLSTIELTNESLNDYVDVMVQTFTNSTKLLGERTQIVNTPNIIEWTDRYKKRIGLESGTDPTGSELAIYNGQREYLVPIFNRGQTITISYLNSPNGPEVPTIWLSAEQQGVKVKFRVPQNKIWGVPQPRAAFIGVLIGIAGLYPLVTWLSNPWWIGSLALVYGLLAQVPGAFSVKFYRWCREAIGG